LRLADLEKRSTIKLNIEVYRGIRCDVIIIVIIIIGRPLKSVEEIYRRIKRVLEYGLTLRLSLGVSE
jgi:hypothetical protein